MKQVKDVWVLHCSFSFSLCVNFFKIKREKEWEIEKVKLSLAIMFSIKNKINTGSESLHSPQVQDTLSAT